MRVFPCPGAMARSTPNPTFRPAPDGNASVEIEGELTDGLDFAVTEKLAGGVPSPTGEILLTASIDT